MDTSEMIALYHGLGKKIEKSLADPENTVKDVEEIMQASNLSVSNMQRFVALLRDSHAISIPDFSWIDKMQENTSEMVGVAQEIKRVQEGKKKKRRKRRRKRPSKKRSIQDRLSISSRKKRLTTVTKMPFEVCFFVLENPLIMEGDELQILKDTDSFFYDIAPFEKGDSNWKDLNTAVLYGVLTNGNDHYSIWTSFFGDDENNGQIHFYHMKGGYTENSMPKALVEAVNDKHGTYALTAKPPTGQTHSWDSGGPEEPPEDFYKVHLRAGYVSGQKREDDHDPQDREYSHRWRVRGHTRVLTKRGALPLERWKKKDLEKRGYDVYTSIAEVTDDHLSELEKRGKDRLPEDEWLALRVMWINEQIRGPEDKPLIESIHIARK